jgi:thiol-disulfide isomerase/thioredoxin
MNNVISFTKQTLIIVFLAMFLSCTNMQNNKNQLPEPKIKAGTAKITGTITNLKLPDGEKKVTIAVWVNNPVTAEQSKYVTNLNADNRFSIEVPLETNTAICGFNVWIGTNSYSSYSIGLDQDKELQMNIVFDDKQDYKIETKGGLTLAFDDMKSINTAMGRFFYSHTWGSYYKMTSKEFVDHELNVGLKERIHVSMDSLPFSEKIKNHMVNDFNLLFLKGRVFDYKGTAERSFKGDKEGHSSTATHTAVEPDKSYYSFLKNYDLNNPQYLYCYHYSEFMKSFLNIAPFKIPLLEDQPIEEWLKGVKASVQDVVGFSSGLFYDMLAASSYARQMGDSKDPLTNKQIENIKNYYKNGNEEIGKILLKKSSELIKIIGSNYDLKVNSTPTVAKEKLIDAIIAKYKGSVVLVDFWATWCGPCMNAMVDMKPVKTELKGKGVVFVYLSNISSPKPLWEGTIKGIGGEQYYLMANEWESVMDKFGFTGIPSYLIYDKSGKLKQKFTGFPGTDKMRGMLKELL